MAALLAVNKECEEHSRNLYLIIRSEYVDLRDSTMKDWLEWIGRPITGNDVRYENGSILMFRHGKDLNALKNANLGGCLMVQAEEMTEQDYWFIKGRLRRKQGTRQLRLECNYDGHNWIYKLFNKEKVGTLITTNTFDNAKNLPAGYIEGLEKLPKRIRERHLYGSDAETEGLCFESFQESKHIINPFSPPKEWERVVVLDHGYSNPTSILFAAVDFDGKLYIYDEHYEAKQLVSYHAKAIKSHMEGFDPLYYIDPSCNSKTNSRNGQLYSIVDEYRDEGIDFLPANNSVLAGINRVNEYFASNTLYITRNCFNLIDEIHQYRWLQLRPGQEKNEPDAPRKYKDHACDCLRYLVMSRPDASERQEQEQESTYSERVWQRLNKRLKAQNNNRVTLYDYETLYD